MMKTIFIACPKNNPSQTIFVAHMAIALCFTFKTALVKIALASDDIEMFLAKRYHISLKKNINLPTPAYFQFSKNLFKDLQNEYACLIADAQNCDHTENADILVVPAFDDDDIKALIDHNSPFATMIWTAKKNRAKTGKDAFKCVVLPLETLDDQKLTKTAPMMGYIIGPKLQKNDVYKKGFEQGITALDKDLPDFSKDFKADDFFARRNLKKIIEYILSL